MTAIELLQDIETALWKAAHRLAARTGGGRHAAHLTAEDLYQEGAIEAIQAVGRWRPEGGAGLPAWCLARGKGAMLDALRRWREEWSRINGEYATRLPWKAAVGAGKYDSAGRRLEESFPAEEEKPDIDSGEENVRAALREIGVSLTQQECRCVAEYFGGNRTMREISQSIGKCESRVHQMISRALLAARDAVETRGLTQHEVGELIGVS